MKKLMMIILCLSYLACEDVIEVDAPGEAPRLVIDALIRVDVNDPTFETIIKVSETNAFFGQVSPAGLDQITLINQCTSEFHVLLEEEVGSGVYSKVTGPDFFTSGEILLQVRYQEQTFLATTEFVPSAEINSIVQGDNTLFDEDEKEVVINFTDNADRTDFYLFDFSFENYLTTEDTFYEDQEFEFSYFYDEDLQIGDEIEISIMGVDEEFYNYMNLLIEQSEGDVGPFQTPSITARGNIINATGIDNIDNFNNVNMSSNFALGYFAVVEERKEILIIE